MTTEMVIAIGSLITGIAGIISAILLYRKTVALLEYRMENVEKKLDEHNGYAEKFAESSVAITALQKDVEYIKEKIK